MDFIKEIQEIVKKELCSVNSCHDWEHTERVYNLAMHIGKIEKADLEVLALASLLHDVGRKAEEETKGKIDHALKGSEMAREILEKYGLNEKKIQKICHCIETHRSRANRIPESLEAKILYDSDKLDSIGAIGIGRIFSFAGHIGAKVHNKGVNLNEVEEYSLDDTAWREWELKLKHVFSRIYTDEGKRIAKERHEFMEGFFDRLNKEVDGEL
ncbi:MAG: HD domain-containing protein [Candidatus Pacebacteria bacterium]|nr:HD domain-containing protein [Candidatus Paceibacterota bacterium]